MRKALSWLLLVALLSVTNILPAWSQGGGFSGGGGSGGGGGLQAADIGYYVPGVHTPVGNETLTTSTQNTINCGDNSRSLTLPLAASCMGKYFEGWCRGGTSSFNASGSDVIKNFAGNTNSSISFGNNGITGFNAGYWCKIESDGTSWVEKRYEPETCGGGGTYIISNSGSQTLSGTQQTYLPVSIGSVVLSSGTGTASLGGITDSSTQVFLGSPTTTGETFKWSITSGTLTITSSNPASTAQVGFFAIGF